MTAAQCVALIWRFVVDINPAVLKAMANGFIRDALKNLKDAERNLSSNKNSRELLNASAELSAISDELQALHDKLLR
jgi:hypothetical protein